MTLLDYIKPLDRAALDGLARRCATSAGHLKQVAYGNRRANAALAIALDRETGGELRCEVIRPDIDWAYLRASRSERESAAGLVEKPITPRKGERRIDDRRVAERRDGERRSEAA